MTAEHLTDRPAVNKREHPSPEILALFMAGQASLADNRLVVRHLLAGCASCVAVTRGIWQGTTTLREAQGDAFAVEAGLGTRAAWEQS